MAEIDIEVGDFVIRLAKTREELLEIQKLRYNDMILDYNETCQNVDGLDVSPFDDHCDHIYAYDKVKKQVVGTYRLITSEHLRANENFICSSEYDISAITTENKLILELGRATVHHDYRNGVVLRLMWRYLFCYVVEKQIDYIIGTASYHGLDCSLYRHSLAALYYDGHTFATPVIPSLDQPVKLCSEMLSKEKIDVKKVKLETPPLIRSYLLMGAKVSNEMYFDRSFNSMDVFVFFDAKTMNYEFIEKFIGIKLKGENRHE